MKLKKPVYHTSFVTVSELAGHVMRRKFVNKEKN